MRVFISWSGQVSKSVALALREWLPDVIQQIDPFVSSEDIRKGNRWSLDLAGELTSVQYGIICLTRDNLLSPWVNFEAGALSKALDGSLWTLLIGEILPSDVTGPLAQFQHSSLEEEDFFKLLLSMNEVLGEDGLEIQRLKRVYENFWPSLKKRAEGILNEVDTNLAHQNIRSDREILEEILDLSRSLAQTSIRTDIFKSGTPNETVLIPGMIVDHPTFGDGKVLAIGSSGKHKTATVLFKSVGQKTINLSYGKLLPLG